MNRLTNEKFKLRQKRKLLKAMTKMSRKRNKLSYKLKEADTKISDLLATYRKRYEY